MALEQAIKEALLKAKASPDDLKEIFETIGINITLPAPNSDKAEIQKWYDELKALLTKKQEEVKTDKPDAHEGDKGMSEKIASLESLIGTLVSRFETTDKALEAERKAARTKEITDYLAEMEKDGRLAPKDEEKKKLYSDLLEKDYDNTKKLFEGLPKNPVISGENPKPVTGGTIIARDDNRTAHEKMVAAAKDQIKNAIKV